MAEIQAKGIEELALEVFEITKTTWATAHRSKPDAAHDLTEAEFLALDALQRAPSLTVGHLQRRIGVLPAQMSRIIKSLETNYDRPLVRCAINPADKRKIDVRIARPGRRAADAFRRSKLNVTVQALKALSPRDIAQLARIVGIIRKAMGA